jgi:hypothetical protein
MTILEQLPTVDIAEDEREQPPSVEPEALAAAELAECTCPEFCERDHGNE